MKYSELQLKFQKICKKTLRLLQFSTHYTQYNCKSLNTSFRSMLERFATELDPQFRQICIVRKMSVGNVRRQKISRAYNSFRYSLSSSNVDVNSSGFMCFQNRHEWLMWPANDATVTARLQFANRNTVRGKQKKLA